MGRLLTRIAEMLERDERATSERRPATGNCPQCGAGPDKRQDCSSIAATTKEIYCGVCAYNFSEESES